jgi:shikimate dehydrogenase
MAKLKYGIVGHPVKHSLSPAMQTAAFKEAGLDAEYVLYDIPPGGLADFLGSLKNIRISGVNVTIPHKIRAKEYLERNGSLDPVAEKLGAVNTIKVSGEDGSLRGYNTDGPGFYSSLVEDLKFAPEGKRVFILGAGGAAKAVAMYLGDSPARISVFDIDAARTNSLREHYVKYFDPDRIEVLSDRKRLKDAIGESDLLVNATPVGMDDADPSPVDKGLLHGGLYVYDLVYNRPCTRLVKEAGSMNLRAVTGAGMLLYQGAIAFEIWTGRKAPVEVMRRTLLKSLGN